MLTHNFFKLVLTFVEKKIYLLEFFVIENNLKYPHNFKNFSNKINFLTYFGS